MIISHKYKYLFVELPRTGTESIKNELIEYYDGHEIHSKHSRYSKFIKHSTRQEKQYFVFSCIRDPYERTFSLYSKIKNNQYNQWSNFRKTRFLKISSFLHYRRYKYVNSHKKSFYDFLRSFYKMPYDDWGSLDHKKFDYIINFNSLNEDFTNVLEKLNIDKVRDLPIVNKTKKENFIPFDDLSEEYRRIFTPYLIVNKNLFSKKYKNLTASNLDILKYKFFNFLKRIYWRCIY